MTLHLSKVLIERQRPLTPYEWHQVLWHLFSVPAGGPRPLLFRIEQQGPGGTQVLLQSDREPTTSATARGARVRLVATRRFAAKMSAGQGLRFRLTANPIKTIRDEGGRTDGKGNIKQCRVPLIKEEAQLDWLARKFAGAARLDEALIQGRQAVHFRPSAGKVGKIMAVTFDGALTVRDGEQLNTLLTTGIGPAKSLGCGLLSLARV